jgi:arginyl-tRNA synthetase
MNLRAELEKRLSAAMEAAGAPAGTPAMVAPSARAEFGDYQANGVMTAAKAAKVNPRQLAEKVVAAADVADLAEKLEVAGPGFINIRLRPEWLSAEMTRLAGDERLGMARPDRPENVVVDYSAPNLAKEMHVGHLRSTIIGDALARTLEFLGHNVIRQNHVGDWGTQFGMLIAHHMDLVSAIPPIPQRTTARPSIVSIHVADLEDTYREAKARFDSDPGFADRAREMVARLQSGDEEVRKFWAMCVEESLRHMHRVYERLQASLGDKHRRGESAYNDDLPKIVADLRAAGLLTESQGAQCVFLPEFTGKDGAPLPVIIQKSDEGYLYATTDLAAMRYRVRELQAKRMLYVVDARQSLHFQQVFAVARKAGFVPPDVSLEHVGFGVMMGADGKPFKTRTGGTVKLIDLLDEAQERAFRLVSEKSGEMPEDQRRDIARVVGIGAVKYADLSQNRASDYVFSWDKMLSLEGNTAPYMQYAYARVRSIFRKGAESAEQAGAAIQVREPAERALAVRLARFPEIVEAVARECQPNLLCAYLYDVAGAFMGFYENCPVLKAEDAATRASRLLLCDLTARTIQRGLGLLGIETIERM